MLRTEFSTLLLSATAMTLMIMRNLAGIRLLRAAACVASAALALACGKENIKPDVDEDTDIKEGKVVTFTGRFAEDPDDDENPSTKIALDYDTENSKVKVKFSGGEYIKTIVGGGGAENVIKASDINADGSVTFSIGFESTSDPYCFFVADQINTFGSLWKVSPGPVMYTRSNAYNTIAAGRIPHFAWGTCNHDEKNVTFHNILCLLRYTTTTEEASYVDFVGNDGETLIGSMGINYSTGKVTLNTQGVDAYTSVRSNIAGPGKDNYIALMPNVTLSKGFLIKVYDKSGNELYICRVNSEFTTTAGKLIDLGTLEDHKASQYNRWLSGYDIEINGVKYNNTNSTATLVKNSAFAGEDVETGKASLYFIDGEATMGTSTGSNVIVCSNSATSRAKLTFKGKTGIIACNPLVFKDLNIESLTSGYTLAASGSVSQLTFDNCTLTLHSDFADLSSVTSVGKSKWWTATSSLTSRPAAAAAFSIQVIQKTNSPSPACRSRTISSGARTLLWCSASSPPTTLPRRYRPTISISRTTPSTTWTAAHIILLLPPDSSRSLCLGQSRRPAR